MIIVSGPSTIGKNPLIELMCNQFNYKFIVPITTRNKRAKEKEAKDYYFIDKDTFKKEISEKKIFEWDYCLSNYYGFYKFNLEGKGIVIHSLSRMAIRLKEKGQNITTIFLVPKNISKIEQTLKQIYNGLELDLRIELVKEEISLSPLFDYTFVVENGTELIENPDFLAIMKRDLSEINLN